MSLQGKRAWITGASSGIGAGIAVALANAGVHVVLTARRLEPLTTLTDSILAAGGNASIKIGDVVDRDAMLSIGHSLDELGGVDILINNAGIMPLSTLASGRAEEWDRVIDVNVKGVLHAIAAAVPGMKARKSGHVINISSVASRMTMPLMGAYCASKHAVRAISDVLRKEGIRYGLRVTDIQPGAVATDLPQSIEQSSTREAITGPGGMYGPDKQNLQVADIANAVLYALQQPAHVDVAEIILRPFHQEN